MSYAPKLCMGYPCTVTRRTGTTRRLLKVGSVVVLLAATALPGLTAQPDPAPGATPAKESAQGNQNTKSDWSWDSPGEAQNDEAKTGAGTSEMLWKMLALVLIVLALGAAAVFVVRRVVPRIAGTAGKRISINETIYLGPKKALHLLQVGRQEFLIASTRDRISMLSEITETFSDGNVDFTGSS